MLKKLAPNSDKARTWFYTSTTMRWLCHWSDRKIWLLWEWLSSVSWLSWKQELQWCSLICMATSVILKCLMAYLTHVGLSVFNKMSCRPTSSHICCHSFVVLFCLMFSMHMQIQKISFSPMFVVTFLISLKEMDFLALNYAQITDTKQNCLVAKILW